MVLRILVWGCASVVASIFRDCLRQGLEISGVSVWGLFRVSFRTSPEVVYGSSS